MPSSTDTLVAPEDIPVSITGLTGDDATALVTWEGDAFIPEGGTVSDGYLSITGGASGTRQVTLSVGGGFVFESSGTATLTFEVVGHPGHLYVDASDGDDATALGTAADPLQTIAYAASVLAEGHTVRVLPGTYSPASGEVFPIWPDGVHIVGSALAGEPDRTAIIITGNDPDPAQRADQLFRWFDASAPARLANLTLRDSVQMALYVDKTSLTLDNVHVTDVNTSDGPRATAIFLRNDSQVTVNDSLFENSYGRGVIGIESQDQNNNNNVTVNRSTFRQTYSAFGTLYGNADVAGRFTVVDSDFIENQVGGSVSQADAVAGVIFYHGRSGYPHALTVNRCRFLGNTGGSVISPTRTIAHVHNSLFAGNDVDSRVFTGLDYGAHLVNCTVVGNRTVFGSHRVGNTATEGWWVRNTIISGNSQLLNTAHAGVLRMQHALLWDTALGSGYDEGQAVNLILENPRLLGGGVAWDDPAFDARLNPRGPAVLAGNNAYVQGDFDLDLGPRILHETVDLGAYETVIPPIGSLFLVR